MNCNQLLQGLTLNVQPGLFTWVYLLAKKNHTTFWHSEIKTGNIVRYKTFCFFTYHEWDIHHLQNMIHYTRIFHNDMIQNQYDQHWVWATQIIHCSSKRDIFAKSPWNCTFHSRLWHGFKSLSRCVSEISRITLSLQWRSTPESQVPLGAPIRSAQSDTMRCMVPSRTHILGDGNICPWGKSFRGKGLMFDVNVLTHVPICIIVTVKPSQ